jgi:hypothetical protein
LDEHAGRDQHALGSQLGEDVGRHVVVAGDVVELQALKVSLELAHLSAISIHRVLLDVAGFVDLIDDDLGVSVRDESLDSEGNSDAHPIDQGHVLNAVVGCLGVDL